MEREKEIQKLANAVLELPPTNTGDYGTGAQCPFCLKMCAWNEDEIKDTPHELDCVVLIAKDLTTGFKTLTE